MMSILTLKCLRTPRANQISTSIFFYSPKLNRQVWCESNLEWDMAILLDQNPTVIDYCEQAIEVEWSKSKWTPDFVAIIDENGQFKVLIIEIKYLQELLGDREHYVQKYTETKEWIQKNAAILKSKISNVPIAEIEFLIVTDAVLQQSFRIRNYRKLIQAKIEGTIDVFIQQKIRGIMQNMAQIPLQTLLNLLNSELKGITYSQDALNATLYAMIYQQEIEIDYDQLLTSTTLIYGNHKPSRTLEQWLKVHNWQDQISLYSPIISHEDLYFIASTPEKSIEYWNIAQDRLNAILPLLNLSYDQIKAYEQTFRGETIHWSTRYNWLRMYREGNGDIRSLLPHFSRCGSKTRPFNTIQNEIWEYGKEQYLRLERKSIQTAYNHMKTFAIDKSQEKWCMSYSSFYRRLLQLDGREVAKRRDGERNAERKYELSESEFPHADFPLQSVQIDHTPLDVIVVDEENRKVTERPYLSVAIDCHTRCILGYYLTYNDPSRLSIAMLLLNCIQNKTKSIEKITQQFPALDPATLKTIQTSEWQNVCGLPFTLHMDNGSDFRSNDIQLFGIRYKVHLHYRAVKKPQHGAYIERFLGTLNHRLQGIAGTTFSNVSMRKDYPSEKYASYTLKEIEARVLTEIMGYHEDFHQHIRMAPIKKWIDAYALKGSETAITHNLSQIDLKTFHYDVLPSEMRSVQKHGIQLFGLNYSDPRIQKWIHAKKDQNRSETRTHLIRYDPRDIRTIYFYDPTEKGYILLKCGDKFVQTYYKTTELTLWQWSTIKRNYLEEYEHSGMEFQSKKRAYIRAQTLMDKETATRTKSARIKRARHQCNQDTRKEFLITGRTTEKDALNLNQPENHFPIEEDNVVYIPTPPDNENPFYGIEIDMVNFQSRKVLPKKE